MSYLQNLDMHWACIAQARKTLPVGSERRIAIVSRSIQGILRAHRDYPESPRFGRTASLTASF